MLSKLKIFNSKKEFIFFLVMFIVSIFATISVYALHFNGPPIRSDGLGYYVYLPSIFVYNDISMNKFIDSYSAHYGDKKTNNWNGVYKYENTQNYLDKYPVGVAVMSFPFFITAHAATLLISHFSGVPPNGYTDPLYHAAQAFSGLFYGLLGLLVLKRILDRYFSQKVIYITLVLITFGTNLFHYFTYDAVFSHAYSFCLFALFILLTIKWYKNPSKINSILIGLNTGLITIVRPTNILIVLFFILYGISFSNLASECLNRFKLFIKQYKKIFLIVFFALIVAAIQITYWYIITGKLIVYSYAGEYFDFTNPQILNVLFSLNKGLFFWCPILLISIPGIFFIKKYIKGYAFAALIFLSVNLYVVSSWWSWSYGGSFGMRALIETFSFLAIPIALTIKKLFEVKSKALKYALFLLISLCCLFTLYMMIQYWRGYLPIDGTNEKLFINALLNINKLPKN